MFFFCWHVVAVIIVHLFSVFNKYKVNPVKRAYVKYLKLARKHGLQYRVYEQNILFCGRENYFQSENWLKQ